VPPTDHPPLPARFPPKLRLIHDAEFQSVFDAKVKKAAGGLIVFGMPNGRPFPRLGLSIGRQVGGAVERNRVKRLIREAFRALQHDIPRPGSQCYDLVVGARTSKGLTLEAVQATLAELIAAVHGVYEKRARRGTRP
jgi:ribonuclease P protein component